MHEYNHCRLLGHSWESYTPVDMPLYVNRRVAIYWLCERCHTIRQETVTRNGEIASRKYIYPFDYLMTEDTKPTRQDLRKMALKERQPKVSKSKVKLRSVS